MTLNNEKGIAVVLTLFFFLILYGFTGIFLLRVVHENNMTKYERASTQAFYAAQSGAEDGLRQMDVLINDYLLTTVAGANPNGVIGYTNGKVSSGDGIGWLVYAVRDNNTAVLTKDGDLALYSDSGTLNSLSYQYDILITEKDDPASSGLDTWDFPYNYTVRASSSVDTVTSTVRIHGDFTVRVQRDNFAKFALFTNIQSMPNGTYVWFTDKTNFAGPVHTNDRFNFALNPSGTFEEEITQEDRRARFYNEGWPILLDADANGSDDIPIFHDTFTRDVDAISLNSPVEEQDFIDQATDGNTYNNNGIYLPNDGNAMTGGIYVKGNCLISMAADGNNNAVYTITQGSNVKTVTIDQANTQTRILDHDTGVEDTFAGFPDGVDDDGTLIYVNGEVSGLAGSVQADSQVTVSSKNDIVISDHVQYENYTPATGNPGDAGYVPPSAVGTNNLLGIISWQGDVRIGTTAPDDVQIHGSVMAADGIFQVDNYNDTGTGPRGTATLLGGLISDNYGAFGLFSGSTGQQLSGYGRNFVYDQRMQMGDAPPYFPSLNTFIAFTNDITDKMVWQEGN